MMGARARERERDCARICAVGKRGRQRDDIECFAYGTIDLSKWVAKALLIREPNELIDSRTGTYTFAFKATCFQSHSLLLFLRSAPSVNAFVDPGIHPKPSATIIGPSSSILPPSPKFLDLNSGERTHGKHAFPPTHLALLQPTTPPLLTALPPTTSSHQTLS